MGKSMFGQLAKHALIFKDETGGVLSAQTHYSADRRYKYTCFAFTDTLKIDSQGTELKIFGFNKNGTLSNNRRQYLAIIKYDLLHWHHYPNRFIYSVR